MLFDALLEGNRRAILCSSWSFQLGVGDAAWCGPKGEYVSHGREGRGEEEAMIISQTSIGAKEREIHTVQCIPLLFRPRTTARLADKYESLQLRLRFVGFRMYQTHTPHEIFRIYVDIKPHSTWDDSMAHRGVNEIRHT